eukprot:scaffold23316_cov51-Prasinocladus_malaysianus.AAC.3
MACWTLMSDKDTIMNAIQASHDAHLSKIDALEDHLVNKELKGANDLVSTHYCYLNTTVYHQLTQHRRHHYVAGSIDVHNESLGCCAMTLQTAEKTLWTNTRNRERVSEILGMYMRNQQELREALELDYAGDY